MALFLAIEAYFQEALKPHVPLPSSYSVLLPINEVYTAAEMDRLALEGQYPIMSELIGAVLYCIVFSLLRLVLQKYLIKHLATWCMDLHFAEEKSFSVEEEAYITNNSFSKDELKAYCGMLQLDERPLKRERWNRKRNLINHKKFVKFTEAFWRFLYYSTFIAIGYRVLFYPETAFWLKENDHFWVGWPLYTFNNEDSATFMMKLWYKVELGCYFHQLLWTEVHRSDAMEMILHHIVTILLISTSYLQNMLRIGMLILFLHDIADIFLEAGKCFNYMSKVDRFKWIAQPLTDTLFACFAITFAVSRLYYFPFMCIKSYILDCPVLLGKWPAFNFQILLLVVLQSLHFFWFSLILKMVYKMFVTGNIEKDERSDGEVSDIGDYDDNVDSSIKAEPKKAK